MSDRARALTEARSLRESLLAHGVRRVSVELQTGRAGSWWDGRKIGTLGHHTVSRPSYGDTPTLALVKRGRPDLPPPLYNCYGGYDLVARILCLEWANHSGYGGPMRLPSGVVPKNNGRPYLLGWGFEGGLEDYSREMRAFMASCLAGTLAWLELDENSHAEHGNPWAWLRKIDRRNYYRNLGAARREIAVVLDAARESEDDAMEFRPGTEKTRRWRDVQRGLNDLVQFARRRARERGEEFTTPAWHPLELDGHYGYQRDGRWLPGTSGEAVAWAKSYLEYPGRGDVAPLEFLAQVTAMNVRIPLELAIWRRDKTIDALTARVESLEVGDDT